MAAAPIRIGELVVCSSPSYRQQMGLGLDVGLYLIDRRRDGLVFFAGIDRSAWIPRNNLKAVAADDPRVIAPPAWLAVLHRVMVLLEATDLELEREDDGGFLARIGCGGLEAPRLAKLQAELGPLASRLELRPGSMHRLLVVYPTGAVDNTPIEA